MIRLQTFLVAACLFIFVVMVGISYHLTNQTLLPPFERQEKAQTEAVRQYAASMIESKANILSSFRESLSQDKSLVKKFILAQEDGPNNSQNQLVKGLKNLTHCEIVTFSDVPARKPLEVSVTTYDGKPAIVSRMLLKLNDHPLTLLTLGYYLNSQNTPSIAQATGSKARFILKGEAPPAGWIYSDLPSRFIARHEIGLGIETKPLSAANSATLFQVFENELLGLLVALAFIYLFLRIGFLKKFKLVVSDMNKAALAQDRGELLEIPLRWAPIKEIQMISVVLRKFVKSLSEFQQRVNQKKRTEVVGELTQQLVHDLSRHLLNLELEIDSEMNKFYSDDTKNAINGHFDDIKKLIDRTLDSVQEEKPSSQPFSAQSGELLGLKMVNILPILEAAISKARIDYRANSGLNFEIEKVEGKLPLAYVNPPALLTVLNNLINNAVESYGETPGVVRLTVESDETTIYIGIEDDGQGMSPEILSRVGTRGVTFKPNGTGLGLASAIQTLQSWGGGVHISSRKGEGTRVSLQVSAGDCL